jgi:hypothetical protein
VLDVTDHGDLQPLQRLLVAQDGVGIEQALGRMLMHAIARVDDWNPQISG